MGNIERGEYIRLDSLFVTKDSSITGSLFVVNVCLFWFFSMVGFQSTSGHVSKQVTELTYLPSPADGGRKDADESAFNFAEQGYFCSFSFSMDFPRAFSKPRILIGLSKGFRLHHSLILESAHLTQSLSWSPSPEAMVSKGAMGNCWRKAWGHLARVF